MASERELELIKVLESMVPILERALKTSVTLKTLLAEKGVVSEEEFEAKIRALDVAAAEIELLKRMLRNSQ